MYRTAVLMSTYNGEKYLREQLDSILTQLDTADTADVCIFVRDDGSTDGTRGILEEYAEAHPEVTVTYGENVGVGNSFMQLVYAAPSDFDYYAFSDQDDIWLDGKIAAAVSMLKEQEGPALYASDQLLADADGKLIGSRYGKHMPPFSPMQIVHNNHISGCTFVWNRFLQSLLADPARRPDPALLRVRIHDVWVALAASVCGTIVYDFKSQILYRQHGANVVGAREVTPRDLLEMWRKKIRKKEERCGRSRISSEICRKFPEYLGKYRSTLLMYGFYQRNPHLKRRLLLRVRKEVLYSGEKPAALFVKILLNLF